MCRKTNEVNQEVLQSVNPAHDNLETMSIEEARDMTLAAVREEYARA